MARRPDEQDFSASLTGKLAVLIAIFLTVPIILYTQFQEADQDKQALVLQGVTFKTGSTWLSLASRAVLDQVVASLKQNPDAEVMIRGYTDNVGSREVNMRMSEGRAEAVKKYLVSSGISPARLTAKGLGPDSPVASNATAEGRAKNRRIEFLRIK